MQTIAVDLTKDPDVAALTADMEPGDCIYGCFRLKSRTDQTAVLRLEEMAASKDELSEPDNAMSGDNEDDGDGPDAEDPAETVAEEPPKSRGERMAPAMEGPMMERPGNY